MENFIASLNVLFVPVVMLIFIAVDYKRGVGDILQRKMYLLTILITLLAIVSDIVYDAFAGKPGAATYTLLYVSCFCYYLFQIGAYHLIVIFIDYHINKDKARSQKFITLAIVIQALHLVALVINIKYNFYFVITPDNYYVSGDLYVIRLVFSYLAAVIGIGNVIICREKIQNSQVWLTIMFIVLTGAGSTLDIMFRHFKLVWACFSLSLLFAYFFIIRAETQIDVLTGLYNRRSAEEYIKEISDGNRDITYSFILADLDDFKKINDECGHAQGDQALKEAASLIKSCLRRMDFVARYGGDEFLVILRDERVESVVERLYEAFAVFNEQNERPYQLGVSMGYDQYSPHNSQMAAQEFIAHVDRLMYREKKDRRGMTSKA